MPLGWIDFSKSERNKVLSVLDLLSEAGTLDELGISAVRDGFADIFFPGTSTIQTRAKYFMIVPYALKDLEHSDEKNPNRALRILDEVERKCGESLVRAADTQGIIGSRSLANNMWVKRTPADIYWGGLRNYGFFTGGSLALSEYVRVMCAMKNQKAALTRLGNRNDAAEEGETDDKDAGELFHTQFWNIPTYNSNWFNELSIKLTKEEGAFLKQQIMTVYPDSMLAFILREDMKEIVECTSFQELTAWIDMFPAQIREDYALANEFSELLFVLRTIYNIVVSDGKNETANSVWEDLRPSIAKKAEIDLDRIFSRLNISRNILLCNFLRRSQGLLKNENLEELKIEIKRRERELKGSRAKTLHPGEFDPKQWFGGGLLDYRFSSARTIIRDIFESEGIYVKS